MGNLYYITPWYRSMRIRWGELCGRLGDEVRSGGVVSRHFDDLYAVLEFDSLDDFRQLVFTFQSPPGFGGGVDEFEHHELGGRRRQGSLRPHRAMTDRGEDAFDRV